MYARTYEFLQKHNVLYKNQYGFRKRHSCEHAVTELIGKVCKGLESNKHTIALFIDLSKAFDTIEHNILFSKMESYGIRGTSLNWYKSYLSNCTMGAKSSSGNTGGVSYSELYPLNIGTPQGSCLGPLLFLIFCNDIYLNLELCHGILFADDTTIYNSHSNIYYLKWTVLHNLEILSSWLKANGLSMNCNKTVCMLFSNNKNLSLDKLCIENTTIHFVTLTKFLGIWVDHNLTWKEQINQVEQKICKNINLLKLGKNLIDVHSKRLLYFAQIQSHLSYSLSIWGNMISDTTLSRLQ